MPYRTALVVHPDCGRHDTGWNHPEHQGRLPAVVRAIHEDTPALLEHLLQREAPAASVEDVLLVHAPAHVERIRAAARRAERAGEPVFLDGDTLVSAASWDAALGAVGAAIEAVRLVEAGEVESAFALTRPPGHHATADRAMGFCLFNNAAVAARWLQRRRGVERVLVVDWDIHHGNGTQDIFYDDPTVYYLSLHLDSHYPGTGFRSERGEGAGAGRTRNVPLERGATADEYRRLFERALDDALEEFRPDFFLVSAGFDCLEGDPLGGVALEPADLHALASLVLERARRTAGGRVVALLEGGYVPRRVGEAVVDVIRAFAGLPPK